MTKKQIITALTVGLIATSGVAVDLSTTSIKEIEKTQEDFLISEGQYIHIPKERIRTGSLEPIDVQVDEYLHPDGNRGYAIFLQREDNGVVEEKVISHDKDIQSKRWTEIQSESKDIPTSTTKALEKENEVKNINPSTSTANSTST